jgi:tetratricopeptide (TPR) repeat protein
MKSLLIPFFSLLFLSPLAAQDIAAMIREGDRLEGIPNEKAAFAKFKEVLHYQPNNQYALNKCSELCSRIGKRQTNPKLIDDYYAAAKTYAGVALRINPNNSESNCVMAIALGRSSLNKSGREKINTAKEIKKYVDAAIKNDPKNFKAWHVLGRWHYEISNLNGLERTAVKLFYGGLPDASLRESIMAFEKSQSITDGFILNYFEMAKAYKMNDQPGKAIAILTKMLTVPNQTEDDPIIKEEGRKLIKKWR